MLLEASSWCLDNWTMRLHSTFHNYDTSKLEKKILQIFYENIFAERHYESFKKTYIFHDISNTR